MRVAIFTSHPIQYQAPWFRALASDADLEVRVFFSHVPDENEQGVGFGAPFRWDMDLTSGYESVVLQSDNPPIPHPPFARRIVRDLGNQLDEMRPDAALILGWQEISLVQAYLACRRRQIPIVLRGESNALKPRPAPVALLHKAYVAGAASALAIGNSNADFYRKAGMADDRIVMARYFVDNQRFAKAADEIRPHRQAIRAKWNIPETSFCVLFVGKLEPKKRVLDVLSAIAIARQSGAPLHGLIVGAGEQMDDARAFAAQQALPITFAGFLNQSEIAAAYVAADALALPSDFGETWGLVVNEAMATGLPAIVSDRVGCAHDLVLDRKTGAVAPFGDAAAIGGIFSDWACDKDRIWHLGAQARAHVNAEFTVSAAVKGFKTAAEVAMTL